MCLRTQHCANFPLIKLLKRAPRIHFLNFAFFKMSNVDPHDHTHISAKVKMFFSIFLDTVIKGTGRDVAVLEFMS